MWTPRTIYDWLNQGRPEWQLFHDDSVFEAVIVAHAGGGVVLRYLYRGELYDEQTYSNRTDARRDAAKLHLRLKALGWREDRTSRALSPRPRMRT